MIRTCLVAAPFILGSAALAQQGSFPAPIEPAGVGKMQCHSPDHAKKTCESLAAYQPAADGNFDNVANVIVPTFPGVVMTIISTVRVREGNVCGYIRQGDIDKASFIVGGVDVDAATTSDYRKRVAVLYQPVFDREICSSYVTDGNEFVVRPTIDGAPLPSAAHRVIWVSPDDGWKVG